MQCCGYGQSQISTIQAVGAAEVAIGLATGDVGEVVAGELLMGGGDPLTALVAEEIVDGLL